MLFRSPDGSSTVLANNNAQAPVAAQPKIVTPTWQQAQEKPELMTKGGKLLSLLQTGLEGAARGAAAGVPTNPHISPGLGPSLAAGVETPIAMEEQRNTLAQQGLEQQKEKAQIASLPLQAASQRALVTSEIGRNNAIASTRPSLVASEINRNDAMAETRGDFTSKPGDIRYNRDGTIKGVGANAGDVAQQKQAGKLTGTAQAVGDAGGTPAQVLTAMGVKNPSDKNTSTAQMYLEANGGDPGAAIKAMNKDKVATSSAIHASIANLHAPGDGLTPAQARQLNNDPEYAGLKAQQGALSRSLGNITGDPFKDDPAQTAKMQQSAAALAARMNAVRDRVFQKPTGNALPLKQNANKPAQQYKAGDAVMYKGKPATVAGYDANGQLQLNP